MKPKLKQTKRKVKTYNIMFVHYSNTNIEASCKTEAIKKLKRKYENKEGDMEVVSIIKSS